jgi:hypothetical protein
MADSHEHGAASHGAASQGAASQGPSHGGSVWSHVSSEDRHGLAAEDSQAWRGVTGLLLTIVIGGVLLGFLGVLIATLLT